MIQLPWPAERPGVIAMSVSCEPCADRMDMTGILTR